MSDIMFTEYLKSFGLTGQEATIYEILLTNGTMTGYEIAKSSGISRSNVYSSLAGLVDKGAAYLINGEPARYTPVAVEQFCDNSLQELSRQAQYLKSHAPQRIITTDGYITIQGSRHIRDMIREMLTRCDKRLYMLADAALIEEFRPQLQSLLANNKKVVIITTDFTLEGAKIYQTSLEPHQLRLITDSAYVLTGELRDIESDSCLYSGQANLVSVMKEALKNKIELLER